MRLIREVCHILFPHLCLLCQRRTMGSLICTRCLDINQTGGTRCNRCYSIAANLNEHELCHLCTLYPLPYRSLRYLWEYSGPVKELLRIMKYRPSLGTAKLIGDLAANRFCNPQTHEWDLIVPIPSSSNAIWRRGFNQCEIIAHAVARATNTKCAYGALAHQGYRNSQASLHGNQRIRNVKNAFKANNSIVQNMAILLIDDVVTTGATINAATKALIDGGAASVDVFSIARSPAWNSYRDSL